MGRSHVFAGGVASPLSSSPGEQGGARGPADLCPLPRRVPWEGCRPQPLPRMRGPDRTLGGRPMRTALLGILLLEAQWARDPLASDHRSGPRNRSLHIENSPAAALSVSLSAQRGCPATSPRATPSWGPPPPGARQALSHLRAVWRAEAQEGVGRAGLRPLPRAISPPCPGLSRPGSTKKPRDSR